MSSLGSDQIEGVVARRLEEVVSDRGNVLHFIRHDSLHFTKFGECYFSEVHPGCVKAWKCHREQTQNISVPRGRITLVIFDDRKMSSSKGVLSVFELGRPDNYICVTIPPQLWYGFSCISSDTALVANCPDIPHDPTEAKTIAPAQSHVPYIWSHSITGKNQ